MIIIKYVFVYGPIWVGLLKINNIWIGKYELNQNLDVGE